MAHLIPPDPVKPGQNKDPDWLVVDRFRQRIEELLDDRGFEREYDEIQARTGNANLTGNFTSALQLHNLAKNRYRNILPLEHSRVPLEPVPGQEGSDYVNANFVSGEVPGSERAYICTQGPLPNTVEDFWRMCWEQDCKIIVMLANLVEMGRQKVHPYYPEVEGAKIQYKGVTPDMDLLITCTKMDTSNKDVIIRYFTVNNQKLKLQKEMIHIQYVAWPDQGCPSDTSGFIKCMILANSLQGTHKAPMAVHCSAGIGRTGTFIIVHSIYVKLKMLLSQSVDLRFDVLQTCLDFRSQRAGLVQTKEQYAFCYLSLLDKLSNVLTTLDYKNAPWYYKRMSAQEANDLLKGKPHGSYLFRGSSEPGYISLSAVKKDKILHTRIVVLDEGFKIDDDVYPTVQKLVASRPKVFVHPVVK